MCANGSTLRDLGSRGLEFGMSGVGVFGGGFLISWDVAWSVLSMAGLRVRECAGFGFGCELVGGGVGRDGRIGGLGG